MRINCCRCQESQNCCRNFQFTTSLTVLHTTFHVGHKYILHCEECAGPMVPLLLQHLVIKLENCYPVFAWSSGDNICCLPGGCGLCRTFALAIPFYFLLFISPAENIVLHKTFITIWIFFSLYSIEYQRDIFITFLNENNFYLNSIKCFSTLTMELKHFKFSRPNSGKLF